jgi:hypothetical protein
MNKTIYTILFFACLMCATVAADFREVDCGYGWIGGLCHETELQDEFDDVDDRVDDLDDDIDRVERKSKKRDRQIRGDLNDLDEYVDSNSEKWSEDRVGGGVSFKNVKNYLYSEFLDFLHTVFVPLQFFDDLNRRLDRIESRIQMTTQYFDIESQYTQAEIDCREATVYGNRVNQSVTVNGVTYSPHSALGCVMIRGK